MAVVLELLLRSAFHNLKVFLDQEGIQAEKWPDKLRDALASSRMVITLVGSKWLSVKYEFEERRIDEAEDWVRKEIEMAAEQGKTLLPPSVWYLPSPGAERWATAFLSLYFFHPFRYI